MKTLADPRLVREAPVKREEGHPLDQVREAVRNAYPFDENGHVIIRHVNTRGSTSWYRVNWYRHDSSGAYIDRSRYLAITATPDGLQVEDQTIDRPKPTMN
jgi:hypothetical protein